MTGSYMTTAKQIVELGVEDPDLFVAMALFEEGVGPDRVSDMTTNELRVFASRSRRKNPVGRTRGGEDLVGELWRFHLGRSVAGARVAAHRPRSDAFGRQMAVRRGAVGMAVGVIWVAVTAIGGGGDSDALWR